AHLGRRHPGGPRLPPLPVPQVSKVVGPGRKDRGHAPARGRAQEAAAQVKEVVVHDKAKWHVEGKFPPDLDRRQAYVPGGLLIAWLANRGLLSQMAEREFAPELARLRSRSITGPEAYRLVGGALASDLLDPAADAFLADYLDPDRGGYWAD